MGLGDGCALPDGAGCGREPADDDDGRRGCRERDVDAVDLDTGCKRAGEVESGGDGGSEGDCARVANRRGIVLCGGEGGRDDVGADGVDVGHEREWEGGAVDGGERRDGCVGGMESRDLVGGVQCGRGACERVTAGERGCIGVDERHGLRWEHGSGWVQRGVEDGAHGAGEYDVGERDKCAEPGGGGYDEKQGGVGDGGGSVWECFHVVVMGLRVSEPRCSCERRGGRVHKFYDLRVTDAEHGSDEGGADVV